MKFCVFVVHFEIFGLLSLRERDRYVLGEIQMCLLINLEGRVCRLNALYVCLFIPNNIHIKNKVCFMFSSNSLG